MHYLIRRVAAALALLAAACGGTPQQQDQAAAPEGNAASNSGAMESTETAPSRIPSTNAILSEEPFTPESAQGAATVVETYYALLEAGKYDEARRLRWNADELDPERFAAGFAPYSEYHATVGAPSEIQGAAGSLYVEVPVQIYGRRKDGKPFGQTGTVTLRRVNDVPGSTPEQRRWRIYSN